MEKSKLSESYVEVDSSDEFSIVDENNCGNDIGYSSDGPLNSIRFHQLPGSTVCVPVDSSPTSVSQPGAAFMSQSMVGSDEATKKDDKEYSLHDSRINQVLELRQQIDRLEAELSVTNRTLKGSLAQLESQKVAFDEVKKNLETELQNVKEEEERVKAENTKLFAKIEEYEKSNDKNVLKSLGDAATQMKAIDSETENAKIIQDEYAKMNQSVERMGNSLSEEYESEMPGVQSDNKLKQELIDELKSKLDDVQSLTEQLPPAIQAYVKEREEKENAMKMVKEYEAGFKKALEKKDNNVNHLAESFVELNVKSVLDNFNTHSIPETYMCLQCWRHFRNTQEAKFHDGSCTSGFDAHF